MAVIDLKWGLGTIPVEYDQDLVTILDDRTELPELSDVAIGEKLENPIGSNPIEEIVGRDETVLIVVPDATRQTGCGQMVNLLVRRLIANGTAPHEIRIIFATGIHRKVTEAEKALILTPFIAQRIRTIDHDPRDLMQLVRVGETTGGIPVELNRALFEHDHIVLVGGVTFHYFAGFTGGRKLVCPGLASSRTISETHKLAFDCETRSRRERVGTGQLECNVVHEAFVEAASFARPAFAMMSITDQYGIVVDMFCGEWRTSHTAACAAYAQRYSVDITEKREVVVASCGGYPYDINMIQAHKALEAASKACIEGGTIVFLAECREGTGRDDFLKWFSDDSSDSLATRLCQKYQVNGQTAWSLLEKAERFDVRIVTEFDASTAAKMRLRKIDATEIAGIISGRKGYILTDGARYNIRAASS